MTKETQKKRILDRRGDASEDTLKMLAGVFDFYDLPGEFEKNTYNVHITEYMTPKDVMQKVLKILKL